MNDSEALLVVERGPIPTLQVALENEQLTVGRSSGNDLVLVDPEVSRRHIRIIRRADGFAVEDTGSTNGTFVNGQRISHLTLLQDGDTIDLGDTVRLRYLSSTRLPAVSEPEPVGMTDRPTQAYSPAMHQPVEPVVNGPRPATPPVSPPPATAIPVAATPVAPQPPTPNLAPPPAFAPPPSYATESPRRGRGLWIGCGLLVALLLVCAGTFLVLDTYDQGRLLYCGPVASVFELILGPFGFAPACP